MLNDVRRFLLFLDPPNPLLKLDIIYVRSLIVNHPNYVYLNLQKSMYLGLQAYPSPFMKKRRNTSIDAT